MDKEITTIPKIIHYCWFGKKNKSELARRCISSWYKNLSDYEIIEWNEKKFNIKKAPRFVKEAYKVGKYAFVADYVRLYALYNYGGIYFDTDVEVIRDFDKFLNYQAFIGYEDNRSRICIQTGVIGSEKGNEIINDWMNYYRTSIFILPDKEYNTRTNVDIITEDLVKRGLVLDEKYSVVQDNLHVFPKDYFCPKDPDDNINLTENSVCIHYYSGSWCRVIPKRHRWLVNMIGENNYYRLGKIKKLLKHTK